MKVSSFTHLPFSSLAYFFLNFWPLSKLFLLFLLKTCYFINKFQIILITLKIKIATVLADTAVLAPSQVELVHLCVMVLAFQPFIAIAAKVYSRTYLLNPSSEMQAFSYTLPYFFTTPHQSSCLILYILQGLRQLSKSISLHPLCFHFERLSCPCW